MYILGVTYCAKIHSGYILPVLKNRHYLLNNLLLLIGGTHGHGTLI